MSGVKKEKAKKRKIMEQLPFRLKVLFIIKADTKNIVRENIKNINNLIIKLTNVLDNLRLIIYQHIIHFLINNHLSVIRIQIIDKKNHNLLVASFIKTRINKIFSKG